MFARGRSKRNTERTGQLSLMIEFENLPIYVNSCAFFESMLELFLASYLIVFNRFGSISGLIGS